MCTPGTFGRFGGIRRGIVSFLLWVSVAVAGCKRTPDLFSCETTVDQEIPSPDGQHVAVVFHHDCGATTDFNTQVSLRDHKHDFDPEADTVLTVAGSYKMMVAWSSNKRIVVSMPNDKVYTQLTKWNGIDIDYAPQGAAE
jgi:hypothetical protein